MLLKNLLFQNGNSGCIATAIARRSRSGVTPEDTNLRIGGQLRIDVADSREKIRINGGVPDTTLARLGALPNTRQLVRRYILASNVTVKSRLLGAAAEFNYDIPHFLSEIGMPNQSDSQIGIPFLPMILTKRDNVGLVVHRHQGSGNPVDSGDFVRQTDLQRCCTLGRLSTNNNLSGHTCQN